MNYKITFNSVSKKFVIRVDGMVIDKPFKTHAQAIARLTTLQRRAQEKRA